MAVQLRGRRQIAAQLEVVEGTDPGSMAAAHALQRVVSPAHTPNIIKEPRDVARASFTQLPGVVGGGTQQFSFGVELAGHSSGIGSVPEWAKFLRASGFHQGAINSITIGAVTSGPFIHGETITSDATGAPTGIVVKDTATGTTTLYYEARVGTIGNGDTLTGSLSGATATTSSTASSAGYAWWPVTISTKLLTVTSPSNTLSIGDEVVGGTSGARAYATRATASGDTSVYVRMLEGGFSDSETITGPGSYSATMASSGSVAADDIPTLTIYLYKDGRIAKATGCRGNVEFQFDANRKAMANFTFEGIYATEVDGDNLTVTTYPSKIPPAFKNATFSLDDGTDTLSTARFNSISVAMNNTLTVREDAEASGGFAPAQILGRAATMAWNPDGVDGDVFDFMSNYENGTEALASWTLGSASGNKLEFWIPGHQINSVGDDDRDGVSVASVTADLTGGIYEANTVLGSDNDLVILYI